MINPETGLIECEVKSCDATLKNDKWNKIKKGINWLFARTDEREMHWCPAHIPDWYTRWAKTQAYSIKK